MGYRKTVNFLLTGLALTLLLPSCALFRRDQANEEQEEQPRYLLTAVGHVNSYEKESGIILVRTYGQLGDKPSVAFISNGPTGTSGNLKFTGQQNNLFSAAELKGGTLETGDIVYRRSLNPKFIEETVTGEKQQDDIVLEPDKKPEPFEGIGL